MWEVSFWKDRTRYESIKTCIPVSVSDLLMLLELSEFWRHPQPYVDGVIFLVAVADIRWGKESSWSNACYISVANSVLKHALRSSFRWKVWRVRYAFQCSAMVRPNGILDLR